MSGFDFDFHVKDHFQVLKLRMGGDKYGNKWYNQFLNFDRIFLEKKYEMLLDCKRQSIKMQIPSAEEIAGKIVVSTVHIFFTCKVLKPNWQNVFTIMESFLKTKFRLKIFKITVLTQISRIGLECFLKRNWWKMWQNKEQERCIWKMSGEDMRNILNVLKNDNKMCN